MAPILPFMAAITPGLGGSLELTVADQQPTKTAIGTFESLTGRLRPVWKC
jgi:hypothetical protein